MQRALAVSIFALLITSAAHADCWQDAARAYGHSTLELAAIACVESGLNANAINRSHIQRTGTVDVSVMQINTGNLKQLKKEGVQLQDLWNVCTNIMLGAKILAEKKVKYGQTWEAVGSYNAACTQLKGDACQAARKTYAWKVFRAQQHLLARGTC